LIYLSTEALAAAEAPRQIAVRLAQTGVIGLSAVRNVFGALRHTCIYILCRRCTIQMVNGGDRNISNRTASTAQDCGDCIDGRRSTGTSSLCGRRNQATYGAEERISAI